MAGLQRSEVSFRRQGSSGLVWDDKFLSGELNQIAKQQKEEKQNNKTKKLHEEDASAAVAAGSTIERSRSSGGRAYRTGKVSPAIEPPSPKVSACGFCGAFGKNNNTRRRRPNSGKRVV